MQSPFELFAQALSEAKSSENSFDMSRTSSLTTGLHRPTKSAGYSLLSPASRFVDGQHPDSQQQSPETVNTANGGSSDDASPGRIETGSPSRRAARTEGNRYASPGRSDLHSRHAKPQSVQHAAQDLAQTSDPHKHLKTALTSALYQAAPQVSAEAAPESNKQEAEALQSLADNLDIGSPSVTSIDHLRKSIEKRRKSDESVRGLHRLQIASGTKHCWCVTYLVKCHFATRLPFKHAIGTKLCITRQ